MLIKSKRITIRIFATFLILSLTLCLFTISVSASDYRGMNDTVYKSADFWGLEELPYGTNTGVVQFQYDTDKFLTLYFDRLSIYDHYRKNLFNEMYGFVYDHYWSAYWDNSSGVWDYKLNIMTDSPIYYKKTYASNGTFSSQVGTLTSQVVWFETIIDNSIDFEGLSYPLYVLEDFSVNSLVPDWTLNSNYQYRRIYSNCYQIKQTTIDGNPYYVTARAGGTTQTPSNLQQVGYNVEYYPSVEYLQNLSSRDVLLKQYDELVYISGELYTVNSYLNSIYELDLSILGNLETYLPLMYGELFDIHDVLEDILSGPEYDESDSVGSNTEFGDAAGGLMSDTQVPSVGIDGIKSNLGSAFLCIRGVFDWIVSEFNLTYVISFLLGMSFIAYVLGRVIKNKMNN